MSTLKDRLTSSLLSHFVPSPCLGLDIGSCSIKSVGLVKRKKEYILDSFDCIDILDETGDVSSNYDIKRFYKLFNLLQRRKGKSARITTAVGGEAVVIAQIKYPVMTEEELKESIKWEAKKYIPFTLEEAQIDFQILRDNGSGSMDVLLAAVKKDVLENHRNLTRKLDILSPIIDIAPLALVNSFLFNYGDSLSSDPAILLDIGADSTILSIFKEESEYFLRMIGISGNTMTQSISDQLHIDAAEAEKMKREADSIDEFVEPVLDNMALEIKKSLTYYKNLTRNDNFSRILLSGGGALLGNIAEFLSERLHVPVELFKPFRNVETDSLESYDRERLNIISPSLSLAFGLALRGVDG